MEFLRESLAYLETEVWDLPENRRVHRLCSRKNVIGDHNLSVPYIISFTPLNDNPYTWKNYAADIREFVSNRIEL